MPNLPDVPIGESVHVGCKSCAIGTSCHEGRADYCPTNGEWTHYGNNSYNCGAGKHKFYCKRQSYGADPLQCCINEDSTYRDKTCDPQYRSSTTPGCRSLLIDYCDSSANAFKPVCSKFLKNLERTSPGTVNRIASQVCIGGNADRPECACYSAELPEELAGNTAKAIYRCLDSGCQSPDAWNTLNCNIAYTKCSIIDPTLVINDSEVNKVTIANECGNTCIDCDPTNYSTDYPSPPPPSNGITLDSKTIVIFGAGLSMIVIVIMVMFLLLGAKKK